MSTNKTSSNDMRRQDRFPVSREIRAYDRQSGREIGRIVNISAEGIMLLGNAPVGENIILELLLDCGDSEAGHVSLGVECLWCHSNDDRSQYWSGHYIIDISSRDMERLLALAG